MHEDGRLYVPGAADIIPNLDQLTRFARRAKVPVIASADDHQPADAEISESPDFATTYPPHCMRGTAGAERIPETRQAWSLEVAHEPLSRSELSAALAVPQPLLLIKKSTVDVFSNPNTEKILEILAPERIVLYGVALDICNRYAIEGLLERGYERIDLVTDATKPIDANLADRLLQDWRQRGVGELTTGALLAELG